MQFAIIEHMPLRAANIDDAKCVLNILRSSRNEFLPYAKSVHTIEQDLRWISKQLIPSGSVVIAECDGEPVGVLATSVSDGVAWINQLYIAPGYIGKGHGTQLLMHALNVLPRPVYLWTFQQNHRARSFYEYHGFKAVKQTNGESNEERCPDVLYLFDGATASQST